MDDVELAPATCPACEISESQSARFEKERLPGMRQVWRYVAPEPTQPSQRVSE